MGIFGFLMKYPVIDKTPLLGFLEHEKAETTAVLKEKNNNIPCWIIGS